GRAGDLELPHLCACLGEVEDPKPQRSTDGSRSLQEGSAVHVHGTPPAQNCVATRSERSPCCNSLSRLREPLTPGRNPGAEAWGGHPGRRPLRRLDPSARVQAPRPAPDGPLDLVKSA